MLNVSHPGPPLTIAQLIEILQKLPPDTDLRCTNALTEFEPQVYRHVPLDMGSKSRVKALVSGVSRITITLERWWPDKPEQCEGVTVQRVNEEFGTVLPDKPPAQPKLSVMERAASMLRRLEWCVESPFWMDRDVTTSCPVCGQGSVVGLPASHTEGCELAALIKELET